VQPPAHFNTEGHNYDTYRGKICFYDGTVIYKGSLDNAKAHDGKEVAWALLDETKDTKESAVKEVITGRLREHGLYYDSMGVLSDIGVNPVTGEKHTPWNPLYILTSPAKVPWINEWFSLDEHVDEIVQHIYSETDYFSKDIGNKRATISSTFHNQRNLPSNYISNQMANLHSALQDMLIYGNPFTSAGGEFYKCFNRQQHVIDVTKVQHEVDGNMEYVFDDKARARAYNSKIPLHISFDFNVNPYMTCTVWQVMGKTAYQIDEICLSNPRNTTVDTCMEFVRRYQGHEAGLFVYGDPSGRSEDTKMEKGHNNFTIIMRKLEQFKPALRIQAAAPPVVMRGNFINTVFEKGYEGMQIFIHQTCTKSIADFVYLKENSEGTKLKEKVKNEETGVTYEKYGHTSDSADYFLCVAFVSEYNKYKIGGVAAAPPGIWKSIKSRNTY